MALSETAQGWPSLRDVAMMTMEIWAVKSYDAVHAAVAFLADAPIVTADRGFARIPPEGLPIYTDSRSIPGLPLATGRSGSRALTGFLRPGCAPRM